MASDSGVVDTSVGKSIAIGIIFSIIAIIPAIIIDVIFAFS
jgi:nitrogen fixation/metabolism regulation signal transduction histidine kinase